MADVADEEPEADPWVGRTLAEAFQILEPLGEGAMGTVYLAEQLSVERRVVVKLMHPELAADRTAVGRFQREARAVAQLAHPHVVAVHTFGEAEDGQLYLVMEHVRGEPLGRVIEREGALGEARALRIAEQIAAALAEAHAANVVHRDLKPDNVMLTEWAGRPEHVKVLDFGVAKLLGNVSMERSLTGTGYIAGTPRYMSPEQARAQPIDGRSDLYGLGLLLYEMLTGDLPYAADTPLDMLLKHVQEPAPPPSELHPDLGLSPDTDAVVSQLLAKGPDQRFASAEAAGAAIRNALDPPSPSAAAPAVGPTEDPADESSTVAEGPPSPAAGAAEPAPASAGEPDASAAGTPAGEPAEAAASEDARPRPPSGGVAETGPGASPPRSSRTMLAVVLGMVTVALAAGVLGWWLASQQDTEPAPSRDRGTPSPQTSRSSAPSPGQAPKQPTARPGPAQPTRQGGAPTAVPAAPADVPDVSASGVDAGGAGTTIPGVPMPDRARFYARTGQQVTLRGELEPETAIAFYRRELAEHWDLDVRGSTIRVHDEEAPLERVVVGRRAGETWISLLRNPRTVEEQKDPKAEVFDTPIHPSAHEMTRTTNVAVYRADADLTEVIDYYARIFRNAEAAEVHRTSSGEDSVLTVQIGDEGHPLESLTVTSQQGSAMISMKARDAAPPGGSADDGP